MPDRFVTLPASKINVQENFNHRTEIDVSDLTKSIEQHGLLEPLVVAENGGDTYDLIAGERRFTACILAGVEEIPVVIREPRDKKLPEAEAAVIAAVENMQRADLHPVEQARAVASIRDRGYTTRRQIATKLNLSEKQVKALEAINGCPLEVREMMLKDHPPVAFAPVIAEINRVAGERLATFVTKRAVDDQRQWYLPDFESSWPSLLIQPYGFSDEEWEKLDPPDVFVCRKDGGNIEWNLLKGLDEKSQQKAAEIEQTQEWEYEPAFDKPDLEAAIAYDCVIELPPRHEGGQPLIIVTDLEWLLDRVQSAIIPRDLRRCRKIARELAEQKADPSAPKPEPPANESIDSEAQRRGVSTDVVKEERKEKREEQAASREAADVFNVELGKQMFEKLNAVEITTEIADYLVALILRDDLGDLARRGLTYLHPAWRVDDELKNGNVKTTFIETQEEARKKVDTFLADARTPEEKISRVLQLCFAAEFADNSVVPRSRRMGQKLRARQDAVEHFEKAEEKAMTKLVNRLKPQLRAEAKKRRDARKSEGAWNA